MADATKNADGSSAAPASADLAQPEELTALRDRLLGELQRAADAGFVKLRGAADQADRPAIPADTAEIAADGQIARTALAPRRWPDNAPPGMAITLGTADSPGPEAGEALEVAAKPEVEPRATQLPVPPPPPRCFAAAELALPAHLPPAELAAAISRARSRLIGEFDRPNPPGVLALARLYLAHGFTAEAGLALALFPLPEGPGQGPRLLAQLLSDEMDADAADRMAAQLATEGCGPLHRLWRAVADLARGNEARALVAVDALGAMLERLPLRVRRVLSIRFGHAALKAENLSLAGRMEAMAARDGGAALDAELQLLVADTAHRRNDLGRALSTLAPLRRGIGRPAVHASLMAAEIALAGPPELIAGTQNLQIELGGLARVWRGDALGSAALIAEARLVAATEGVGPALALLDHGQSVGLIDDAARLSEAKALSTGPAAASGPTPLAVLYHANPERFAGGLADRGFRLALARSYATIDAPQLAREILRPGDLGAEGLAPALAEAALDSTDRDTARWLLAEAPAGLERADALAELVGGQRPAARAVHADDRREPVSLTTPERAQLAAARAGFDAAPSPASAALLALTATEFGQPVPDAARTLIAEAEPALARSLDALARTDPARPADPADAAQRLLQAAEIEATALRRLINDG